MKLTLACLACLIAVVLAAGAVGWTPTYARWGDDGIRSMEAVGVICLVSAAIGMLPMAIVARWWPSYVGQAALMGMVVRLLLALGLIVGYQTMAQPHMASFLAWAVIFYCLLLAVDAAFGVLAVRRYYHSPNQPHAGGAMA